MRRSIVDGFVLVCLVLWQACGVALGATAGQPRGPNVLLIMTDDND
jgi:hypothetical protein